MDLQQRTKDIQHKFQTVSSPLEEVMNNAAPGNTKSYAKTLFALARETMTNYELGVQAHQAGQIQQLAWATRNLLELVTWSEYCAKSIDNAKRFHEDALRDLLGALQVMDNMAVLTPQSSSQDLATFKIMIEEFKRQISDIAVRNGITTLDSNYKWVSKVARELGDEQSIAYKNVNVLLSKFVHPTSLVISEVLDPQWTGVMMNIFLELATISPDGSLDDIARAEL
jgi:hypothetical protein